VDSLLVKTLHTVSAEYDLYSFTCPYDTGHFIAMPPPANNHFLKCVVKVYQFVNEISNEIWLEIQWHLRKGKKIRDQKKSGWIQLDKLN